MTSLASRPVSVDPASVERTVLPNGLTVLVRRDDAAPVVAVVTHVKAGYFDETDDVVGIAHVLEHMFFKGTPTRGVGEIAKQTKASGGYLNAATIYDHTVYYTVLPSSGLVAGLEIQADAYANSVIDAGELGRELEVIIQEAKRKSDNPGACHDRDVVRAPTRSPSHAPLAHRTRSRAPSPDARRPGSLLPQLLSPVVDDPVDRR
jgi:zinc protease